VAGRTQLFSLRKQGIREIYEVTRKRSGIRRSGLPSPAPMDFDAVAESIRHSLDTMEVWSCEYRVCLPERGIRWLDGHSVRSGYRTGVRFGMATFVT